MPEYITRVNVEVIVTSQNPPESAIAMVKSMLACPAVTGLKVRGVRSNYALHAEPLETLVDAGEDGRNWHREWVEYNKQRNQ